MTLLLLLQPFEKQLGESWFLLPRSWFDRWQQWMHGGETPPDIIDNDCLLDADGLPNLALRQRDVVGVNKRAWGLLLGIYGGDWRAAVHAQ